MQRRAPGLRRKSQPERRRPMRHSRHAHGARWIFIVHKRMAEAY